MRGTMAVISWRSRKARTWLKGAARREVVRCWKRVGTFDIGKIR